MPETLGKARTFGHRPEFGPHHASRLWRHGSIRPSAKAAIGARAHALRVADDLRHPFEPVGDGLWMFDKIDQAVDAPGDEELVVVKRQFFRNP